MEAGRCGAQTIQGTPCRSKVPGSEERCWIHKGPQCVVCLGPMSHHQANRTLPCGHIFHSKCVDRWKRSCPGDPTCPMCREPFDTPLYRCRLIIERVSDSQRAVENFDAENIQEIVESFGIDFRSLMHTGSGRLYTDIHFDIEPSEVLEDVLRELGLPDGPRHFG